MLVHSPLPYRNVESYPPHVCWDVWKERDNREFINEERSEEIVTDIICKLLVKNMKSCKWKKSVIPPNQKEQKIARN